MKYNKDNKTKKLDELTEKLEKGMRDLYNSDNYKSYLNTMSNFTKYSSRNIMLINFQNGNATYVAGFKKWIELERNVKKGEKCIHIFAPVKVKFSEKKLLEIEKRNIPKEEKEKIIKAGGTSYRLVPVFDVGQTEGKSLPKIVKPLEGTVDEYGAFFNAIKEVSPFKISICSEAEIYKAIGSKDANGYCDFKNKEIVIKDNLPERQTLKTLIHELAHAKMHGDRDKFSREVKEIQAESVAYVVSQKFGIDTGDFSFGYLASWSNHDKEMKELKGSLQIILEESNVLIDAIEEKFKGHLKVKDVTLEELPKKEKNVGR